MTACTWGVPTDDDWSVGSDWTPGGGPPKAFSDSATIGLGGFTVTLDVNEQIGALTINGSGARLAIGANSLKISSIFGLAGTATVSSAFITIAGGLLSASGGVTVGGGALPDGFRGPPRTISGNANLLSAP